MKKIANHLNPESKLATLDHMQKITMQSIAIMETESPPAIYIDSNTFTATLNPQESLNLGSKSNSNSKPQTPTFLPSIIRQEKEASEFSLSKFSTPKKLLTYTLTPFF
jgi:hypothetical protein